MSGDRSGADSARDAQLLRAISSLQEMRGRLEAIQAAGCEPIAIIGMACRLPGGADTEALWRLVRAGGDAITETPAQRWDVGTLYDAALDTPGKVATRWGGFLEGIDRFDAPFFGISPRESAQMDPQQRLLLEVAWETFEHGGQAVDRLAGSPTGVFVGVMSQSDDYFLLQASDPDAVDLYTGTGTSHSVAAGRISYLLDLHGPSMAIDTACSSSLVAVHLAVQSLRRGECSLALAAGVNVMVEPTFTMIASRMGMMSPTGRCRTFDADADGYVRSEGCAAVLLKRLSDAVADGDRVLAVVAGSAVNQDGRSNGLTAPNSASQEAVLRAALADARTGPADVDVIEAHGTGTPLGDPIELEALRAVFGSTGRDEPVALGSVKANIGHTEGVAGVAGLIKTVLSLRAGEVAPLAHHRRLNPHSSLAGTPLTIPAGVIPWPQHGGRRVAGVSSFGWSGTNAHVVVAEAPGAASAVGAPNHVDDGARARILPLSARDTAALRSMAAATRDLVASGADLAALCATAARRRSHHVHRLAVTAADGAEIVEALDAYVCGDEHRALSAGSRPTRRDGLLAFVFAGQGSQWPAMGADLYAADPVFRASIERCAAALAPHTDWSLIELVEGGDGTNGLLDRIDVVQPALFAIQVAQAAVLASWGIVPDAVVGHSMGEVAAAHVAGALTLDDAAHVIAVRSRLLRTLAGHGAMAVVALDLDATAEAIAPFGGRISIAVNNSRSSTVVAGEAGAVGELVDQLEARDVFCRPVNVDVASHSPMVEPILDRLRTELATIRPVAGSVRFISTVTAEVADGASLDADHWVRNLRESVLFAPAMDVLIADGHVSFVELGAHPVLCRSIEEALVDAGTGGVAVPTMRRESNGNLDLLGAVGGLYAAGTDLDWARIVADQPVVDLPAYPWQRERHWLALQAPTRRTGGGLRHPAETTGLVHPVTWRPAPAAAGSRDAVDCWVVIATAGADTEALQAALASGGGAVDALSAESLATGASSMPRAATTQRRGVVFVAGTGPTDAQLVADVATFVRLAAELAEQPHPSTLWLVTTGVHAVDAGDPDDIGADFANGALWGAGRAVAEELPDVWGGSIDLDARWTPAAAAAELVDELAHVAGDVAEAEVARRPGGRFVPRLTTVDLPPVDPPTFRPDSAVLVTGGFGAVGRPLTRWLAAQGARHIVLAGRTELPPRGTWAGLDAESSTGRRAAFVRELEGLGVAVHAVSLDTADAPAVDGFLARWSDEQRPPIRAVFHAAADFGGELVSELTPTTVRAQLLPKLVAARAFHLMPDLDHLVLFSSAASVVPMAGQAAYAAANAALDALAAHRRATGRPASSLSWGFWEGSDEAFEGDLGRRHTSSGVTFKAAARTMLASRGIGSFSPDAGLEAMSRVMASPIAHALIAPVDRTAMGESAVSAMASLVSDVADADRGGPVAGGASTGGALRAALEGSAPGDRLDVAEAGARDVLARVLRLPGQRIDRAAPFGSLGLDSMMSIEVRNLLERQLGMKLPATLVWNHPTLAELAAHLVTLVEPADEASGAGIVEDLETRPIDGGSVVTIRAEVAELSDLEALAALMGDEAR